MGSREPESRNKSKRVVQITNNKMTADRIEMDLEGGVVFDFDRKQHDR